MGPDEAMIAGAEERQALTVGAVGTFFVVDAGCGNTACNGFTKHACGLARLLIGAGVIGSAFVVEA